MPKVIVVNQERCNGCQLCQLGCTVKKTGQAGLHLARIRVEKLASGGATVITCHHCEEPVCATACLIEAIARDQQGLTARDEDLCIGCQACVVMCPWGAIAFDPRREVALSCDLCGGEPLCVSLCPAGALQLLDEPDASLARRQMAAERMAAASSLWHL